MLNFKNGGTTDFDYISVLGNYVTYIRFSMCVPHSVHTAPEFSYIVDHSFINVPIIIVEGFRMSRGFLVINYERRGSLGKERKVCCEHTHTNQ